MARPSESCEALLVGKLGVGDDTPEGVGVKHGGHGVARKHSYWTVADNVATTCINRLRRA